MQLKVTNSLSCITNAQPRLHTVHDAETIRKKEYFLINMYFKRALRLALATA